MNKMKRIGDSSIVKMAYSQKPIPEDLDKLDVPAYVMLRELYAMFKDKKMDKNTAECIKAVLVNLDGSKIKDELSAIQYFIMTFAEKARNKKENSDFEYLEILITKYFQVVHDKCL